MQVYFPLSLALLIASPFCSLASFAEESLPDTAQVILESMNREIETIKKKAELEIESSLQKCVEQLQKLQDELTKQAKLDEAVAIRDRIRLLKAGGITPVPAPTSMSEHANKVGQVFYFELTGASTGWLFGTDVYTCDSSLATVAIHCGALKLGEKGVVKVTVMPGRASYESSSKNGIASSNWSTYPASYKVERISWLKPK